MIKREALAKVFSCEFCEISKNSFCYRAPPVAAFAYDCLVEFQVDHCSYIHDVFQINRVPFDIVGIVGICGGAD